MRAKLSKINVCKVETIVKRASNGGCLVLSYAGKLDSISNGTANGKSRIKKFMEHNSKDVIGYYEVSETMDADAVRKMVTSDIQDMIVAGVLFS